jgi:hypothetical protein
MPGVVAGRRSQMSIANYRRAEAHFNATQSPADAVEVARTAEGAIAEACELISSLRDELGSAMTERELFYDKLRGVRLIATRMEQAPAAQIGELLTELLSELEEIV